MKNKEEDVVNWPLDKIIQGNEIIDRALKDNGLENTSQEDLQIGHALAKEKAKHFQTDVVGINTLEISLNNIQKEIEKRQARS